MTRMSAPPDNFDDLEKLLRLKRHEQPPPRFYKDFSGSVLRRIERGEGRLSWWERFGFDLRPALAAGAGLVACGLIVYGVATTDGDVAPSGMDFTLQTSAVPARVSQPVTQLADVQRGLEANSTNPVPTYSTPVDRRLFRAGAVTPASFQTGAQ